MFKLNQKSNICKYERFSEQSLLSLMHKCLQQVFGVLSDNPPIYHYWFDGENQSIILPLSKWRGLSNAILYCELHFKYFLLRLSAI